MSTVVTALLFLVFTAGWLAGLASCQGRGGASAEVLSDITGRLVGDDAPVGRFPYMCSLRRRGSRQHVCGATLVHPLWVLTAAHCLVSNKTNRAGLVPIVHCGIHDLNERNSDLIFNGIRTVVHTSWSRVLQEGYDIAMVQLDRLAQLTVPVLSAPGNVPAHTELLAALGWGATPTDPDPDKLQMTTHLPFSSYKTCNAYWKGILPSNIVICAGIGDRDTCGGDSGGPLLTVDAPGGEVGDGEAGLDLLRGVVSFGSKSCGEGTRPGVYTDVGYFREWIQAVVEGRSPPSKGSTQPPQPDPCATAPKLKDVVAAIKKDDLATVRTALGCGVDPGSRYNDTSLTEDGSTDGTLLHWTARYDSSDSAKVLIASSAASEAKDIAGNTPLHYSAFFGGPSVAKVLLDGGANANAKGPNDVTPLHHAARLNRIKTAESVLARFSSTCSVRPKRNPNLALLPRKQPSPLRAMILLEYKAVVDPTSAFGETPLHMAAGIGNVAVIKALVDAGAVLNAVDRTGETPLHEAAEYGRADAVEALVDAEASKTIEDNRGNKAEDVACSHRSARCSTSTRSRIEKLLET